MKVQFLSASYLAPLESFWRVKYPGQNLSPGEIIFSPIEKNYAWFLPETMMPELSVLNYVLSDLIWNCKENNISLILVSFSSFVVSIVRLAIQDQTLKMDEVNFWWVENESGERKYLTLELK